MVGVCIKYFHENYGGMLQAFATTKLLEALGIDYELIQYKKKRNFVQKVKSLPRLLNGVLLNDKYEALIKKIGKKKHPEFAENDRIRIKAFERFKEQHFTKISPVFEEYDDLCAGAKRYQAVITGSDQLWSPAGLPTNYYNLMFVPDGITKISYASSFGVGRIPWYQRKRTSQYLERIDHISMREERGREIVKELTGRDVPTVLDPVFMLDRNEWDRLIPRGEVLEDQYIFAYFLGNNPEHRKVVTEAAKNLNIKIVALHHLDQYVPNDEDFGDVAMYDVGPDKFLDLLRGAAYVCTDSFHGSCFSVIYEKQFVVFNRYAEESKHSKNSRIDTLCYNLGLQERRYNADSDLDELLNKVIDYKDVYQKFLVMKADTDKYIKNAFRGISKSESFGEGEDVRGKGC